MNKIVTIFNEKGGSGKTTTAVQLAGTLGLRGYDVLVADLDPQESSTNWISAAQEGMRFPASLWRADKYKVNITAEMQIQSAKYDIIVADCAPSIGNPTTWGTLLVSDLAIIPSKLNPPDISALVAAKRMARRALEETGRNFPVRVLPNAARLRFKDDAAALSNLQQDKEFPPMRSILADRKAFTRAMQFGCTAHNLPNSKEAVEEIENLADEVLKFLGLPAKRKKGAK
jgi:chromosome partitioning protein